MDQNKTFLPSKKKSASVNENVVEISNKIQYPAPLPEPEMAAKVSDY